jgi:hypothetical protein
MLVLLLVLLLAQLAARAGASNAEGEAFLALNREQPGVVVLASGLQYTVLRAGAGAFHPTVDSQCSCHYTGTLISGKVFDSSVQRGEPIDFAPNQVIKAWTEALQLMVEGDKWRLFCPSELAYGEHGAGGTIGPGQVLIFEVELIKIKGSKVPALRKPAVPDGRDVDVDVACESTRGRVLLRVHPAWAPHGAKRFLELVQNRYFDDVALFRRNEWIVQLGARKTPKTDQEVAALPWAKLFPPGRHHIPSIPDDAPTDCGGRCTKRSLFDGALSL